jgi:pyruvate-ferredoxin/flavodoxin oxidoreductase
VACHNPSYITKDFPIVQDVKPGGIFLINCQWNLEELEHHLSAAAKRYIARNNIQLYTINAIDLAIKVGMGKRTNTILQAAFFALANVLPAEDAIKYMKEAAEHSYLKKGRDVVEKNWAAIDAGAQALVKIDVPAAWAEAEEKKEPVKLEGFEKTVKMVQNILDPVGRMDGDSLPVSTFVDHADGTFELGAAAYEKRGVSVTVPTWNAETCAQCNQCAFVCPHATIRPFLLTAEEAAAAPEGTKMADHKLTKGKYKYAITISPMDCMGCTVCVGVCPTKSLTMTAQESQLAEQKVFDYMVKDVTVKEDVAGPDNVIKSQFLKPYLEFSGSCAGCAETSYARLVTQLYGDHMFVSNATGCSSIWGGPAATSPYTKNKDGKGVAWANSLFEDNAENGFGIYLGQKVIRDALKAKTEELLKLTHYQPLIDAAQKWLDTYDDGDANQAAAAEYIAALDDAVGTIDTCIDFYSSDRAKQIFGDKQPEKLAKAEAAKAAGEKLCMCPACHLGAEIQAQKEYLNKKSVWIFGGDGWAFDIGFGGLDHVLASGEDVNVFVFNTEVYSNTGGQASKASNIGQVAQFAAAGKEIKSKSLAEIAMTYGYVYVAQVAMGANMNQTLKAIREAEAWHGPSLIIGYSPCEMHSIKGGMANCQTEMKKAVDCGYWNLFRYNPDGKKFTLDSKEPKGGYQEFLANEARYARLATSFPERAQRLFAENEANAKERFEHLQKLKAMYE